ncbi:MAG: undecaprenyldiphospho-muramoylpentapeptide beta-N-acetylglucosaminyltransferase [Thermodesulfobacteriota bacterium]
MTDGLRLLICGGGTGGHLFPGIAVAEELCRRDPANSITFAVTDRRLDREALAGRGWESVVIRGSGIKRMGLAGTLRGLARLPLGLLDAIRLLRRVRPQVVLGVGGYVTGPVLIAARLLGIATCIHEQNSVPGATNRLLGKIVHRVFLSYPDHGDCFAAGRTVLTGNPVRRDLLAAAAAKGEGRDLVIIGGSQGAHKVNLLVTGALARLAGRLPEGLTVVHQTGANDEEMVRASYREMGIRSEVAGFFRDMASVYRRAALVVCRAGAISLAEVSLFGLPAIIIPFPYAADNHQEKNGRFLADAGAALMRLESSTDERMLADDIETLLGDADRRAGMAAAARHQARPGATAAIADGCLALAGAKQDCPQGLGVLL